MTSKESKAWLVGVSDKLRKLLRKSPKFVVKADSPHGTSADGWYVRVGQSKAAKTTEIECWFDHYFGVLRPKIFWYGFFWSSRASLRKACGLWETRVEKKSRIGNKDVAFRKRAYTLKKPRKTGRAYLEKYDTHSYLGFYRPSNGTAASASRLALEASHFLNEALAKDGRIEYSYVERRILKKEDLTALEERHRGAETACFRRNRALLEKCKRRDKHTCTVCRFNFEAFYGGLFKEYAEAHHIVPLHKRKGRKPTKLSGLVTVCANCHRMLHHRMPGTRADLKTLRRLVKKAKSAS